MRDTWTAVAISLIWFFTTILLLSSKVPNPEGFYTYLMALTVIIFYLGLGRV